MPHTIDTLIEELQNLKANGLPGTTRVGIPQRDNDGIDRLVNLEFTPCVTKVSKCDFEKDWALCKKVPRGGVDILVLAD